MNATRNRFKVILVIAILTFLMLGCSEADKTQTTIMPTDETQATLALSEAEVENIVKRSYQYVAMYNVNNKFALKQGGWNSNCKSLMNMVVSKSGAVLIWLTITLWLGPGLALHLSSGQNRSLHILAEPSLLQQYAILK